MPELEEIVSADVVAMHRQARRCWPTMRGEGEGAQCLGISGQTGKADQCFGVDLVDLRKVPCKGLLLYTIPCVTSGRASKRPFANDTIFNREEVKYQAMATQFLPVIATTAPPLYANIDYKLWVPRGVD